MKTKLIFLATIIGSFFIACSQNDTATPGNSNPPPNPGTPELVKSTLCEGTWHVTYYYNNGKDETYHLKSYTFYFNQSGSCSATLSSNSYMGLWHSKWDDSSVKLTLTFPNPAELLEISDDWQVIETLENKIRLEDVSGGNGGIDKLTFERV